MKREKIIYFGLLVIVFLVSTLFFSYAFFTGKSEHHGKLNIVAGDLNYKIESDDLVNNQITLEANTTKEITLILTSLNDINSKYELYYVLDSANNGVSVGYSPNTKDTVSGTINADSFKEITVIINNESNTDTTVTFGVVGGFINNSLVLTQGNSLNKVIEIQNNFAQTIFANNALIDAEPTLTTSSNNTTDASGLYKSTATNDGSATYYFRGNVENNYVEFAGFTWRIVRINEDGTVRLILQDEIDDVDYVFNSNSNDKLYMYYSNSSETGIKKIVDQWYTNNIANNINYSSIVVVGKYCEQAKTAYISSMESNSGASMTVYSSYKPDFKCTADGNGKGILEENVGLISYDEVVYAGGYFGKGNSSYYLYNNGINWWTMSPAGIGESALQWYVNETGYLYSKYSNTSRLRPVINIKADTIVTGFGTSTEPYKVVIQENDSLTIGQSVTAIDGSKWHVLEASGSDSKYVTLLSDYNLNSDGTYNTECSIDINSSYLCSPMAFDSDNTNTYDETDSNNIAYFIKNTYKPMVTSKLLGTTNVTLPTAFQIAAVDDVEFDVTTLDPYTLTSSWLFTTNYWTRTANSSNLGYVWHTYGSTFGLGNTWAYADGYGARPVITTLKTNLLAN